MSTLPNKGKIRTRFAPSPTGGLHIGGVRTALYNYLFAHRHGGEFILRIEDTDQTRFVEGAETYIIDTLEWCGIAPTESPVHGGSFAPYRQSERKTIYKEHAEKLVAEGFAYYAFDTAEELNIAREKQANFQYGHATRMGMKNSLSLPVSEWKSMIDSGAPFVIRFKVEPGETLVLNDLIRGEVRFHSGEADDKVLMKADGMPTYHLAVVVDDFEMQITHAFRGEEWLPSAPIHILIWRALFGLEAMPTWAHLPLILKPDGNGKLSKRDGDRLGFPTFPIDWTDPSTQQKTIGFKERGFLPEAFVNMLAALGWNDGTGQEIFGLDDLIEKFDIGRVHKGGAKFDYEKAKWYNHEWLKRVPVDRIVEIVAEDFILKGYGTEKDALGRKLEKIVPLILDRCSIIEDFEKQCGYFFQAPASIDIPSILPKWNPAKTVFFEEVTAIFGTIEQWEAQVVEDRFKQHCVKSQIKANDLLLPLRIMLVGGKFGPSVFDIAEILGKQPCLARISKGLDEIKKLMSDKHEQLHS